MHKIRTSAAAREKDGTPAQTPVRNGIFQKKGSVRRGWIRKSESWNPEFGFLTSWFLARSVLGWTGSDRLSRGLSRSTIGAGGFNGRVRNGIGWNSPARTTSPAKNALLRKRPWLDRNQTSETGNQKTELRNYVNRFAIGLTSDFRFPTSDFRHPASEAGTRRS